MKPVIIDMKDMSDSTEVYSSRPHPFFIIFIYLILGIVVTAIIWSCIWKMDIVVKSNGTFKTEDTISSISSTASGKVTECNLSEGKHVREGDVLFTVNHDEADNDIATYEELLADIDDRLAVMKAYIKYLDGDKDELESLSESKYYMEFMNKNRLVGTSIDASNISSSNEVSQYEQSVTSLKSSIEYYQAQMANYEKMLEGIRNLDNTFAQEDTYYYTVMDSYITSYNAAAKQYDDKVAQYEKQRDSAVESEKASFDSAIADMKGQKDSALNSLKLERIASVEQQIETTKGTLLTLRTNLDTANTQLSAAQNGTSALSNSATVLTEKNSINAEILTYESRRLEYEKNIQSVKDNIEKCQVTAKTSGYISMLGELNVGNYIQEGTNVCQILPENSESYYADVYMSNQDIGKVVEGQQVKFEIAAFPSSEYGYFTGVIDTISKDVKVDGNSGSAYYLVKVKCDKTSLCNKQGDTVSIMNGMACQAKIITDEQSVMEYVLRKIDLVD